MNITWIKLRGVVRSLTSISFHLDRIANCLEADLKYRQIPISTPPPDKSNPPEIFYTDEEADFVREMEEMEKRAQGRLSERDPNEPEA